MALLLAFSAIAADLPGEEIFVSPVTTTTIKSPAPTAKPSSLKMAPQLPKGATNLPTDYLKPLGRESTASELITPPKGSAEIFRALRVGEEVSVWVNHSVIAFPDEKAPVVAVPSEGKFRGLRFIGQSTLERNTQRIFVEFSRVAIGDQIFNLKGTGVSSEGQPGLIGEYHSREAEYFTGDFISSFVAGYFDGLVPRRTNALGQIETDTSVDSAVKKGLASGALSTADRFREKLKKVPEFSELKGPFPMKILILEQAKSIN